MTGILGAGVHDVLQYVSVKVHDYKTNPEIQIDLHLGL